jgi:hypothetical protein
VRVSVLARSAASGLHLPRACTLNSDCDAGVCSQANGKQFCPPPMSFCMSG